MNSFVPGVLVEILPDVYRVLAPNPSVMTGPGTNTYLLGSDNITVLDPGPDTPEHIDAIVKGIELIGGRFERVVVTHTHTDHSPGAAVLARNFSVPVYGAAIADDGYQDDSFHADFGIVDGQRLPVDDSQLEAIYTPGHVANHYCFLHHKSGAVFTGDHIMQGSTVVIIPPAGDMADYVTSLQRLLHYPIRYLAPGHGSVIDEPEAEIKKLIAHRQTREDKIVAALASVKVADLDELLPIAYNDVPESIYPVARLSLLAHVLKLQRETKVTERAGKWSLLARVC